MKYSVEAKQSDPVMDFVMLMLHARTNAHILHWTTPSKSDHEALNIFYEGVPSLLDEFVQSFQGKFGKLHDFQAGFEPATQALPFITAVCEKIEFIRQQPRFPKDTFLQNKVDEILLLSYDVKYQIEGLK